MTYMVYVRLESLADVRTFTLRIQPIGQICQAYIGENHGKPVATQPGNLHFLGQMRQGFDGQTAR